MPIKVKPYDNDWFKRLNTGKMFMKLKNMEQSLEEMDNIVKKVTVPRKHKIQKPSKAKLDIAHKLLLDKAEKRQPL